MSMNAAELGLRRTGKPKDAQYADRIAAILRERGSDIPLPHQSAGPQSRELSPIEVVRFTPEVRSALEARGLSIFELTGQSLSSIREQELLSITTSWRRPYPKLEAEKSHTTEVAIYTDPEKFWLPNSNNRSLTEQKLMVGTFAQELARGIGLDEFKAIIGSTPDYVELAAILYVLGVDLFGNDYKFARTMTQTNGAYVVCVGSSDASDGLFVEDWHRDSGYDSVFASPLVMPASPAGEPKQ